MAKTITVSKQASIVNYKEAVNSTSGIEAGFLITPLIDGAAQLLIYARVTPSLNRVNLSPRTALSARGITETAAQAKYMADDAAIKTFFGLTNVGDTGAALGFPYIKLDAGGVYWDTTTAAFTQSAIFSTTETAGVTISVDGNHKYLNYFDNKTGDFGAVPATVTAGTDTPTTEKNFLGLTVRQTWLAVGGAVLAVLAYIDPLKVWRKNKGGRPKKK